MNQLDALKKSKDQLLLEQEARTVMRNEVGARKTQLENTKKDVSQSQMTLADKQVQLQKATTRYKKMGGKV